MPSAFDVSYMHSVEYAQHIRVWEAESVKKKISPLSSRSSRGRGGRGVFVLFISPSERSFFPGYLLNIFNVCESQVSKCESEVQRIVYYKPIGTDLNECVNKIKKKRAWVQDKTSRVIV